MVFLQEENGAVFLWIHWTCHEWQVSVKAVRLVIRSSIWWTRWRSKVMPFWCLPWTNFFAPYLQLNRHVTVQCTKLPTWYTQRGFKRPILFVAKSSHFSTSPVVHSLLWTFFPDIYAFCIPIIFYAFGVCPFLLVTSVYSLFPSSSRFPIFFLVVGPFACFRYLSLRVYLYYNSTMAWSQYWRQTAVCNRHIYPLVIRPIGW